MVLARESAFLKQLGLPVNRISLVQNFNLASSSLNLVQGYYGKTTTHSLGMQLDLINLI